MIKISKGYVVKAQGKAKLCADVKGLEEDLTLWFAIEEEQEDFLDRKGGECFVLGLLPLAMKTGQQMEYEGTLSRRFVHGINEYLIPSLMPNGAPYHKVTLRAAAYAPEEPKSVQGIAMHLSDAEDFPEILEKHKQDSLYPLTCLCAFCEESEPVKERKASLQKMADAYKLPAVLLEHNLGSLYKEKTRYTKAFSELSCAYALSGYLSIYLYYSNQALTGKQAERKEEKNQDELLCTVISTVHMRVYLFD